MIVPPVLVWGSRGDGPGRFHSPNGLAAFRAAAARAGASAAGRIRSPRIADVLVVDSRNHRIQRFDADGAFQECWDPAVEYRGSKPDEHKNRLHFPEGISAGALGDFYVADTLRNHRIVRLDARGTALESIGGDGNSTHGSGTDLGSFLWPHGVAARGDLLVVSDTGNNRIQIFRMPAAPGGRFYLEAVVGRRGAGPGLFSAPAGVAVSPEAEIFVCDWGNHRIQVLDARGAWLRQWGERGSEPGRLCHPYELCLMPGGVVAVGDFGNDRIQLFDGEGRFLGCFGAKGTEPGRFLGPAGLLWLEGGETASGEPGSGRLYVADSFNHRIQAFVLPAEVRGGEPRAGAETAVARSFAGLASAPRAPKPLEPGPAARWVAELLREDAAVYHVSEDGRRGWWGRGYYDWNPPCCTWSRHPLYRETAWRVEPYLLLGAITGRRAYRCRAVRALDYLVSEQGAEGDYYWWAGEEPDRSGSFYVSGAVGEALAAGYGATGDARYREALRRICVWALGQPTSANVNYNSFITHPLALYYGVSDEDRYLEKALRLNLESVPGSLDDAGRLKDAHNRKTIYTTIILRALMRLLEVMPADHPERKTVRGPAERILADLLARQTAEGGFVASPPGAEPAEHPLIGAPVTCLLLARSKLGWEIEGAGRLEERIEAAMAFLRSCDSGADDRLIVYGYLAYLRDTSPRWNAYRRRFARGLAACERRMHGGERPR